MPNSYLVVAYKDKDRVKALGARWNPEAKRWFVPIGLDLTPFADWLPESETLAPPSTDVSRGVRLSALLGQVGEVLARHFEGPVWILAEVLEASTSERGHVYLQLTDRDSSGNELARARATIWADQARKLLPQFEKESGMHLGPNLKLLIQAKPEYRAQYGLTLNVTAIDATYSLGDLETRRRAILKQLANEGILTANRDLPAPWSFESVLVIAPQSAAGLGDFLSDASRLAKGNVCSFRVAYSRFQGLGACEEIRLAIEKNLLDSGSVPDAIVLIRGGGAVNDLAWLNDLELARYICKLPIPLITGIGHERDSTILDDVANKKCDTPSKVIAHILNVVRSRTSESARNFEEIEARARKTIDFYRAAVARNRHEVELGSQKAIADVGIQCVSSAADIKRDAAGALTRAKGLVVERLSDIRHGSTLRVTKSKGDIRARHQAVRQRAFGDLALVAERTNNGFVQIRLSARSSVSAASSTLSRLAAHTLDRARANADQASIGASNALREINSGLRDSVNRAARAAEALMREIAGQGPERTLKRGFAVVRKQNGKLILKASEVRGDTGVLVTFQDGSLAGNLRSMVKKGESDSGK